MIGLFNFWIEETKGMLVVDLGDMIRGMLMKKREEQKANSSRWQKELVPFEEYIREKITKNVQFIIKHLTTYKAQV